jgi:hypothetical protein
VTPARNPGNGQVLDPASNATSRWLAEEGPYKAGVATPRGVAETGRRAFLSTDAVRTHTRQTMPRDLVLLRYTDPTGRRLAALCRPSEGVETLRRVVGDEEESDREWYRQDHQSAVVIDTDGTVSITSSEDLTLLSFWFAVAASWLKTHGG